MRFDQGVGKQNEKLKFNDLLKAKGIKMYGL